MSWRLAADRVIVQTDRRARAEHGGFCGAVVDGTDARPGPDVAVRPGGPQTDGMLPLSSGRVDFAMAGDMIEVLPAVGRDGPAPAAAAVMRRDPRVVPSPPGTVLDAFRSVGSAGHGGSAGVHLVAAFASRPGGVIGPLQAEPDGDEITAAPAPLAALPLRGNVDTGDVAFRRRAICRTVRGTEGETLPPPSKPAGRP